MSRLRLRETLKLPPIFSRQRFYLRARPSFDLPLTVECVVARVETFRVCERDWSTLGRVAAKRSVLMRSHSLFEIVSVADVMRAVSTRDHACPELHGGERSSFDKLRMSGTSVLPSTSTFSPY